MPEFYNKKTVNIIIESSFFVIVFFFYVLSGNHYISDGRYTLAISEQIYKDKEIKIGKIISADERSNGFPRNLAYFGIVNVIEYPIIFNLINELKKLDVAPQPFSPNSTFYSASDFFNIINELSPNTKTEAIKIQPTFPVWASIYSIPEVIIFNSFGVEGFNGLNFNIKNTLKMQIILSALFSVVSALFLFKTSRLLNNKIFSYFILIWFSMASPIVSELSKSLWNDTIAIMFLSSAIYVIVASLYLNNKFIGWEVVVGFLLASSFMIKPTYFYIASIYSLILLLDRNMFVKEKILYLFTIVVMAVIFFSVNQFLFDSWIQEYFSPSRIEKFKLENLYGLLFSPGRGVVWFMPSWIFVFFYSVYLIFTSVGSKFLRNFLIGNIILLMVGFYSVSGFAHWWGGVSFGPRIIYFLLPIVFFTMQIIFHEENKNYHSRGYGYRRKGMITILLLLFIWEIIVHTGESLTGYGQKWNAQLGNFETALVRLWDWSNPQFLAFAMSQ